MTNSNRATAPAGRHVGFLMPLTLSICGGWLAARNAAFVQSRSGSSLRQYAVTALSACSIASLLVILPVQAQTPASHSAFGSLLNSVQGARSGEASKDNDGSGGDGDGGGSGGPVDTAEAFYISDVEPVVQARCVICHQSGKTADTWQPEGARILFDGNPSQNHVALEDFVSREDVPETWLLEKVVGNAGHGGGPVLTQGSEAYNALAEYLTLTLGVDTSGGAGDDGDFWSATLLEDRETTLRRSGVLLSGTVPNQAMINRAKASDEALRAEILRLMSGDGFHDFLIKGANDRLMTMGLRFGLTFEPGTTDKFPAFADFHGTRPIEVPEEFSENWQQPFLTTGQLQDIFLYSLARAPLELIAHIVETNKSYKQVVTANYTMVNPIMDLAFRANAGFKVSDFMEPNGVFSRRSLAEFRPGVNSGQVPHDDDFKFDYSTETIYGFSDYQQWPHAGVLSTIGWLARYPSTDTNRNRARARWTYFHFLDVDIEKSAPRSTDPDALADTNNPTMNNPACTLCHERMDPVAGSYESFGDQGNYLTGWGANDSLPDSYKHPEWYGGEAGSTGYQEGDTWYRDMRTPGFEDDRASGGKDSLQWLGQQIANGPRFAAASVKFWWPAIFGAEVLRAPADPGLSGYQQKLSAYNAQQALVDGLAAQFEASGFKAKQLLADMIMSPWFRTSGISDQDKAQQRSLAMENVGSGRLLTPEELDRKNKAVFGRSWRDGGEVPWSYEYETAFTNWSSLSTFYGGIDGAAVTTRNRSLTPLMSNVAELMATELSCQVVLEDFHRAPADRVVFNRVDRNMDPSRTAFVESVLGERYNQNDGANDTFEQRIAFSTSGGSVSLKVNEVTPNGCFQEVQGDDDSWVCLHAGVRTVSLYRNGSRIDELSWDEFENSGRFTPEYYFDDSTQQEEIRGWFDEWSEFFYGQTTSRFELAYDLDPGNYEFRVEMGILLPENHTEDGVVVQTSVHSDGFDASSPDGQRIAAQLEDLYLRMTNRPIDPGIRDALLAAMTAHARDVSIQNGWFEGNCDTWGIWGEQYLADPAISEAIYTDTTGMLRAWIMVVHSLMTSFWYLHD